MDDILLTENQIAIMEHTASRPGNWFGTDLGGRDSNDFEGLVKLGYATSEKGPFGDKEIVYRLTSKGKAFLK